MNDESKNMLNNDELEQVTGGNQLGDSASVKSDVFVGRVDMYNGVVGRYYYIVADDKDEWFYGELRDSYELEYTFHTVRTHVFRVTIYNGKPVLGTKQFCGDDYTLYTGMIKPPAISG